MDIIKYVENINGLLKIEIENLTYPYRGFPKANRVLGKLNNVK
jgi:hypothetical protein